MMLDMFMPMPSDGEKQESGDRGMLPWKSYRYAHGFFIKNERIVRF